jgi:ribokinase
MSPATDVAVASPAYLDLTFIGLDRLPAAGEEEFATDLVRSPGGGAITAVGAARLGLRVALASALGRDEAGTAVADALASEGVDTRVGAGRTPVTVAMPLAGERAFVTFEPESPLDGEALAELAPRAIVADLAQATELPAGPQAYVGCGDRSARRFAGTLPSPAQRPRALIVNEREALLLSGADELDQALAALAQFAETVAVTRGADGAVAISGAERHAVPAAETGAVVDTTGAGDLFTAAYVWADLRGGGPRERLEWATLAAALSVTEPTGVGGAVSEANLLDEGTKRGMSALAAGVETRS